MKNKPKISLSCTNFACCPNPEGDFKLWNNCKACSDAEIMAIEMDVPLTERLAAWQWPARSRVTFATKIPIYTFTVCVVSSIVKGEY